MRTVGRWIGWILILVAVAAAINEAYHAIANGTWRPIALGELWYELHRNSLNGAQAGIQRYIAPWLWDPVIVTVLTWPAWAVFGVPGIVLAWFCRRHGGRRASARKFTS